MSSVLTGSPAAPLNPTLARKLTWQYDGLGRVLERTEYAWSVVDAWWAATPTSITRYLYDGWDCVAEFSVSGGTVTHQRSYVWGLDLSGSRTGAGGVGGLVTIYQAPMSSPTAHFTAYDGNGNVIGLVKASDGTLSARYEYGPFGEALRATGDVIAAANPWRFSTKRTDPTTALVHYEYRVYQPTTGRWLSRDPIGEGGGINLVGFVDNRPQGYVDTLGLRIFIVAPPVGGLDHTGFADKVLNGFQSVIGDCAKLHMRPIIRNVETGFLLWKSITPELMGWELYYTNEKAKCACRPCWQWLKAALGENLPPKDIYIHRGNRMDNAYESNDHVYINENLNVQLPTLGPAGNVTQENTRFDVVLWHEAIGHGYRDLTHPNKGWNQKDGGGQDPTILEENNARNCLRLQGVSIDDRVPTYYGWP
jgi:RHS repeat-associated protein